MAEPLVWVITGTSTGLGRLLTLAALHRGDKVIATARARSLSALEDLKAAGAHTMELDVTAKPEQLDSLAGEAVSVYGKVDIVVNNAGYMLVGAIEENTAEETAQQFNTNVFGALNTTRAFLPYMRARKTGTVFWMGSIGGWRTAPTAGLYCVTKWTLRGLSANLHAEIAPLGLRSLCLDFGYFRTSFLTADHRTPYEARIPDYTGMTNAANDRFVAYNGKQPGDPAKAVEVMIDIAHGTGDAGRAIEQGGWPTTGVLFGSDCVGAVQDELDTAKKSQEVWRKISVSTDF